MLNINSKLIASTNPVMKKYIGLSGELTFNDEGLAFFYAQTKFDYTFRTSLVQRYENDGKTLTLFTLNSVYSFEILGNVGMPATVQFSANRQKVTDYLKNIKSKRFHCILDGGPLRGMRSIVSFDKAISRREAMDFITSGEVRDDIEDEIVENIICAVDDEGYLFGLKISIVCETKHIKKEEFEKVGLKGPISEFMKSRFMFKHDDEIYIPLIDALNFFRRG